MVVIEDDEWSETCDSGTLFNVCRAGLGIHLLDLEKKRIYLLYFDETRRTTISSNAVEVCDQGGCSLVPACPTYTYNYELNVSLEVVPSNEEEEILERIYYDEEPKPALETLYETVEYAIERWVYGEYDEESYGPSERVRKVFDRLLEELRRAVEEQKAELPGLPKTVGELIREVLGRR